MLSEWTWCAQEFYECEGGGLAGMFKIREIRMNIMLWWGICRETIKKKFVIRNFSNNIPAMTAFLDPFSFIPHWRNLQTEKYGSRMWGIREKWPLKKLQKLLGNQICKVRAQFCKEVTLVLPGTRCGTYLRSQLSLLLRVFIWKRGE